jgi:O-antigen ligase
VARTRAGAAARLILVIASALLTVASASKGPILELTLALTLIFVLRGQRQTTGGQLVRRVVFAAIALTALGAAVIAMSEFTQFGAVERFSDMASDNSTTVRQQLLRDALLEFDESPVFGSTTVEYNTHLYPHNVVVESLMVGGVVGFAALLVFLICAVYAGVRIYRQLPQCRWLALLFMQYLIGSMLSGSLFGDPLFWAPSLIVIAAAYLPLASTQLGVNSGAASAHRPGQASRIV